MTAPPRFGLNHITTPRRSIPEFFALAQGLGLREVEIRNDLPGPASIASARPEEIRAYAEDAGLTIRSINALQRFNEWTEARAAEAQHLIGYARACGAQALVLCPVNDAAFAPPDKERLAMLRDALRALAPMLAQAGIVGLVEPLGFAECSLRLKREAVEAIRAIGGANRFMLVHDTFHHFVSGETEFFPDWTGLVHVSGVVDPPLAGSEMRDPHRVLVTPDDRIDNLGQIRALRRGGYTGILSFEPFASSVHDAPDIEADLRASMSLINEGLLQEAA